MNNPELNQTYWENNYQNDQTGWDIGYVSPPISSYIDRVKDKSISILLPGAGNSYEAEYLFNKGFKNIHVLDIAKEPLNNLKNRVPLFPDEQLFCEDFFDHQNKYDLIIEQTFFCAIDPNLRLHYSQKMADLLKYQGKLIGVLFDFPLSDKGPPYGGSLDEYQSTFSKTLNVKIIKRCYNSIKPREGRELFIIFEKKNISRS